MVNTAERKFNIIVEEEVTSTNDVASSLCKQGAAHLTTITAEKQTDGRGRRGRTWLKPAAESIACSIVLREGVDDKLPLVTASSLCKTLKKIAPACNIKWPNDILIEGKKVAGLLVEKVSGLDAYILGIGINVNYDDTLPDEATALSLHKSDDVVLHKIEIIEMILEDLSRTLKVYKEEGWSYISMEYQAMCGTFDRDVTWYASDDAKPLKGKAVALNAEGALLIQKDDGTLQAVSSGEIIAQGKVL